jgi:hypothetical protein
MTLQLALFALHLCSGASFLCKAIKAATTRQYLADVSTVLRRLARLQRDLRRDRDSDTRLAATITTVLKEIERWEQMPNRREPFTLEMLALLQQQAKLLPPDGIMHSSSERGQDSLPQRGPLSHVHLSAVVVRNPAGPPGSARPMGSANPLPTRTRRQQADW